MMQLTGKSILLALFVGLVAFALFSAVGCTDDGKSYQDVTFDENGALFEVTYVCTNLHENCYPGAERCWVCLDDEAWDIPPYYILRHGDDYYYVLADDIYWFVKPDDVATYLLWSVVFRNAMPQYLFNEHGLIIPHLYVEWVEANGYANPYVPTWNSEHPRWDDFYDWLDSFNYETPDEPDDNDWDCRHGGRHRHKNHRCKR